MTSTLETNSSQNHPSPVEGMYSEQTAPIERGLAEWGITFPSQERFDDAIKLTSSVEIQPGESYIDMRSIGRNCVKIDDRDPDYELDYRAFTLGTAAKLNEIRTAGGGSTYETVLRSIHTTVEDNIRYSKTKAREIADKVADKPLGERIVNLGEYMRSAAGVCEHQGLICGYLVARFRSFIPDEKAYAQTRRGSRGGHEWLRVETPDDVFILDPAMHYFGRDEVTKQWDYRLTNELVQEGKMILTDRRPKAATRLLNVIRRSFVR